LIPFLSGGADITLAANYEVFFTALDKISCPVSSCVLSDISSCGTPLAGTNTVIGPSDPWTITTKQGVSSGYTSLVCIRCYIGTHTFDWKGKTNPNSGWKIIQRKDCSNYVSLSAGNRNIEALSY